jgi:hypothetical protein
VSVSHIHVDSSLTANWWPAEEAEYGKSSFSKSEVHVEFLLMLNIFSERLDPLLAMCLKVVKLPSH